MPLNIVRDDLVNRREDAIVLPSNEQLIIDGGAGKAVAKAAGLWKLRRACRAAGGCATGDAVATPAFKFPAKYLIHAVGPVWTGEAGDAALLRSAYRSALERAADLDCRSVALPLLSAGTYQCPAHISLSAALSVAEEFLAQSEMQVVIVLFDKSAVAAGLDFLGDVESRIDDAYVQQYHAMAWEEEMHDARGAGMSMPQQSRRRYTQSVSAPRSQPSASFGKPSESGRPDRRERIRDRWQDRREERLSDAAWEPSPDAVPTAPLEADFGALPEDLEKWTICAAAPPDAAFAGEASVQAQDIPDLAAPSMRADTAELPPVAATQPASLESRLDSLDAGFSQTLLHLIDERDLTDSEVYHRANMTRQHFSKIRSNVGYRPSKPTVLALCVALELDLAQTNDLLGRAGFALSHASKFDIIVEYFIERGDYDPFRINETLFYFDQPLLG